MVLAMFYLTSIILALAIVVFPNPLTYDSTDSSINTNFVLDLDSPNDPPLPQDAFMEATTPAVDCTPDASRDDSDPALVLKRDLNACPSNLVPHNFMRAGRKKKLRTPDSPIPAQQNKPTIGHPRSTQEDENSICENYFPHTHHVTCAGPECGLIDSLIAFVLNCHPGKKSLNEIPQLPALNEYPPQAVEEYCCEMYGEDTILRSADHCVKLGNTRMPVINLFKFRELVDEGRKKYGS